MKNVTAADERPLVTATSALESGIGVAGQIIGGERELAGCVEEASEVSQDMLSVASGESAGSLGGERGESRG